MPPSVQPAWPPPEHGVPQRWRALARQTLYGQRQRHYSPPPQRYCQMMPSVSKSPPVRVEAPVLA